METLVLFFSFSLLTATLLRQKVAWGWGGGDAHSVLARSHGGQRCSAESEQTLFSSVSSYLLFLRRVTAAAKARSPRFRTKSCQRSYVFVLGRGWT